MIKHDLDENILRALRMAPASSHVSGEDLCVTANVSRAAIWKHIKSLREDGYEIEASPHLGYRLVSAPDRLIPSEIKWKLKTHIIGREIISYNKVASTNDIAYQLADKGMKEGIVVIAEEQSSGRGRHGRSWNSPPGYGIYISFIVRPDIAPNEIPRITLLSAVSTAKAIRETTGLPAVIKWPNDILINQRKVCGILAEMKAEQDIVDFIIIGIGINVNNPAKQLPPGASSLKEELLAGQNTISRIDLTRKLIEKLDEDYFKLKNEGFGPIMDEWKSLSDMIGSRVKVVMHNRTFEGLAHDIDTDGAIIIRKDAGTLEKVSSGDIVMMRRDA